MPNVDIAESAKLNVTLSDVAITMRDAPALRLHMSIARSAVALVSATVSAAAAPGAAPSRQLWPLRRR